MIAVECAHCKGNWLEIHPMFTEKQRRMANDKAEALKLNKCFYCECPMVRVITEERFISETFDLYKKHVNIRTGSIKMKKEE